MAIVDGREPKRNTEPMTPEDESRYRAAGLGPVVDLMATAPRPCVCGQLGADCERKQCAEWRKAYPA